jgi:small GTP-binding protein
VIQKKICMLGGFGVGKTSLVSRFVHSVFSDKYLTTVGVKIEKKSVDLGDQQVDLIVWDIHGEDDFQKVRMSYLRGAAGYFLVVDGTRPSTLDTALALHENAEKTIGRVPVVLLLNKADLEDQWTIDQTALTGLRLRTIRTSAKTGVEVESAFDELARALVEPRA